MKAFDFALGLTVMVASSGPAMAQPVEALLVPRHEEAMPTSAASGFLQAGTLTAAIAREARLRAGAMEDEVALQSAQPKPQTRGWVARHPVLFGTLVGAGAGAVGAAVMENELFCSGGDEDCFFHGGGRVFVGAGFGAGIGALVGLIAGR